MQMDEGPGEDREDGRDDRKGPSEKIGVGGGDDAVTRIQLAARWSESFAPEENDSLIGMLKRFRMAYDYLDSVLHGVEPLEPEMPETNSRPPEPAAATQPSSYSAPNPPPPPPGEQQQPEPRPW